MSASPSSALRRVLALDTSTERLSIALGTPGVADALWTHEGQGGAQASAAVVPAILDLLGRAGWQLAELDVIAFGAGPGSFTGLRTACAVVQGLAVAARPDGIPVLPVQTLLAVAEDARWQLAQAGQACPSRVVAALDARMNELYVAEYLLTEAGEWHAVGRPWLSAPEALQLSDGWPQAGVGAVPLLAGNVRTAYGERLSAAWRDAPGVTAWPTATALLRLAPRLWVQQGALGAADAQPLYVRDKVAQTTEERERAKTQAAQPIGSQA